MGNNTTYTYVYILQQKKTAWLRDSQMDSIELAEIFFLSFKLLFCCCCCFFEYTDSKNIAAKNYKTDAIFKSICVHNVK